MNKTNEDFTKIVYARAIALTNISDGTLLTCAKESGIFGNDESLKQYTKLNEIRHAWRTYTTKTITSSYKNWMESWDSFISNTRILPEASLK